MNLQDFYKDKTVLITGNTGFKGSWASLILSILGSRVIGIGLKPLTNPDMFSVIKLNDTVRTYYEDIRNYDAVRRIFSAEKPQIVIHMAAQPLVLESYKDPVYTYDVNVMGTVNVCEAVRHTDSVRSFINVTTDKVYKNNEWVYPYREDDVLDGYDPYSNSKSCSELVTAAYIRSFYNNMEIAVSTCRAGNVIGGGDFSENRIIPDCVRAASKGDQIKIRNPHSVRPYQHVLEAVLFYISLARKQYDDISVSGSYNIGPNEDDALTTGELCDIFCREWGDGVSWISTASGNSHEANLLKLDTNKARSLLEWRPLWNVQTAVKNAVEWYKAFYNNENMISVTSQQINRFMCNIS